MNRGLMIQEGFKVPQLILVRFLTVSCNHHRANPFRSQILLIGRYLFPQRLESSNTNGSFIRVKAALEHWICPPALRAKRIGCVKGSEERIQEITVDG